MPQCALQSRAAEVTHGQRSRRVHRLVGVEAEVAGFDSVVSIRYTVARLSPVRFATVANGIGSSLSMTVVSTSSPRTKACTVDCLAERDNCFDFSTTAEC